MPKGGEQTDRDRKRDSKKKGKDKSKFSQKHIRIKQLERSD
jgi:hypothetical protein